MKNKKSCKAWAWWNNEKKEFQFIYNNKLSVQICSGDHFKGAIKRGEGSIKQVVITEI